MEFKVGDTIGKEEEKLLRAHLLTDQDELDEAVERDHRDDVNECMAEIRASLKRCGIRNEYTADVLGSMTDKLEAQRKYCEVEGIPLFAPSVCYTCRRSWTTKLSGESHVTGCPHCHRSWCD